MLDLYLTFILWNSRWYTYYFLLLFSPHNNHLSGGLRTVIDPNLSSQLPCLRQNQSFYFPIQHLSQEYPKGGGQKSQDGSHNHGMKALQHTLESGRILSSELWPPFSSLVVFCINLVKWTREIMKKRERDTHKISFTLELKVEVVAPSWLLWSPSYGQSLP